ncbi:c-type cytochrome [Thalassorhabdomicrobium marinisediminis]|uniref:c-type cytochrome n=1 Tax=Thalassorhabdomicrobium marinisediminis TaxID=2170577 RepID=UPI0024935C1F|nr:cytochrome c [Thalassorhabdomicrobium marinisediminis]
MKNTHRIAAAFAVAAAAIGAGAALVSAQDDGASQTATLFPYDDAAVVAEGQTLYESFCASCHGANLEGQDNWRERGPNGRALAPPHDETGHTWHHPDLQLFQIVKFGTAALVGDGYESDMAGYGEVMTDDEIRAVMAYIKSTWPEEIIERHDEMNAALARELGG